MKIKIALKKLIKHSMVHTHDIAKMKIDNTRSALSESDVLVIPIEGIGWLV